MSRSVYVLLVDRVVEFSNSSPKEKDNFNIEKVNKLQGFKELIGVAEMKELEYESFEDDGFDFDFKRDYYTEFGHETLIFLNRSELAKIFKTRDNQLVNLEHNQAGLFRKGKLIKIKEMKW